MMLPLKRRITIASAILIMCTASSVSASWAIDSPGSVAVARQVTPANWYWGPQNQWSWQNTRRIFPTAQVGRGTRSVSPLVQSYRDLAKISFIDPVTSKRMTIAEMLDVTYTDGFLVLKHGEILAESYRNGLVQEQPHLLMSISKSIVGSLAGILIGNHQLDAGRLVTDYVNEMKGTVYAGATVRNLLDMSVDDPQARAALKSTRGSAREYQAVDEAGGWLPSTAHSAPGLRSYLTGLRRTHGQDGKEFLYLDQSAILIGWVMERATGKDLSRLLSQYLWEKLGAEQDAYMLLDHHQQAYSSAGFNATLRDLGRFGEMMAQGGRYNGEQIVPEQWVTDIRTNGARSGKSDVGLAAPAPWTGHQHGTYRSFWWLANSDCGRFAGVGLGGQLLIIDPIADMVVVKLDSVPNPRLDESTYRTQYQAIDAIIREVSGHGCS